MRLGYKTIAQCINNQDVQYELDLGTFYDIEVVKLYGDYYYRVENNFGKRIEYALYRFKLIEEFQYDSGITREG